MSAKCSVPGCTRWVFEKGLCRGHALAPQGAAAALPPPPPPPPLLSSSSSSLVPVLQKPPVDEAELARCIRSQRRHAIQLVSHSCRQGSRRCARSSGHGKKSRPHHGCTRPRALVQVPAAAAALHDEGNGENIAERRTSVTRLVPRCFEARLVRRARAGGGQRFICREVLFRIKWWLHQLQMDIQ
jgi:hypothetical protein